MWSALSRYVPSGFLSRGSALREPGRLLEDKSSWETKNRAPPVNLLVPRFVTMLMPMPPVCMVRSPPPVVTLISLKASKS